MDDLLSAALSESGLDGFFTPEPNGTSEEIPTSSAPTSSVEVPTTTSDSPSTASQTSTETVSSTPPTPTATPSQPKVLKVLKVVRTGGSALKAIPSGSPLLLSSKPIIIVRKSSALVPTSTGIVTIVSSSSTTAPSPATLISAAPTTQLSNFVTQTVGGGPLNGGHKPTPVKQVTFGENVYFGGSKCSKTSTAAAKNTPVDSSDSEIEYIGTVDRLGRNVLSRNPHVRTAAGRKALEESMKKPISSPSAAVDNSSKIFKKDFWKRAGLDRSSPIQEDIPDLDDDNLGYADTYADYMPTKLKSGLRHPDPVVESSSLASVEPPEVWYNVSIPEEIIDTGQLSALQLEAIIYACQRHEKFFPNGERAGYLVGDGAGVGKGRTVAGIIFENYLLGRKRALWFSVSTDLKYDAERDLSDIGAGHIPVYPLNKFRYSKISGKENGSVKKGVIFATYSSLVGESQTAKGKYKTRLKQLEHWFGDDYDGVIILDECHRAKNLVPVGNSKPTKTGKCVMELQKALPKARVVYASATGACEVRNMGYMTRLGLWGPHMAFETFGDFLGAVEKRGVGAMEIVAMDMKLRGMYLARQLSFAGVTFRVDEVLLEPDFITMYDESVKLWLYARECFQIAEDLMDADDRLRQSMWGQFWSAHQRFFKYLCIAAKVKACVKLAREAVKNGKCAVIGLQSTGEARTTEQLEEMGGEITEFVSTAKGVLKSLIEKQFPAADTLAAMQKIGLQAYYNPRPIIKSSSESQTLNSLESKSKTISNGKANTDSSSESGDEKDSDESSSAETDDSDGSDNDEKDSPDEDETSECEDENFNPFEADSAEEDFWTGKQKEVENEVESTVKKKSKRKSNGVGGSGHKSKKQKKDEKPAKTAVQRSESPTSFFQGVQPNSIFQSQSGLNQAQVMKTDLLARVERLGEVLPPNTLDQLIDDLGGPDFVAEMTGRKGRVVSRDDGTVQYELRNETDVPLEMLNMAEKERFMNGEKNIAIISEAASSGISLQSDRRAINHRRRVHITLELPWSADKAIQQFGRTHRSNEVNAPEYVFLISELAGEKRFASVVAKRLESLGALTHGDRRATETRDLSQFNLDTKYGRLALEEVMKSIVGFSQPRVPMPQDYTGDFFADVRQYLLGVGMLTADAKGNCLLDKDYNSIGKFLNRLLGIPVYTQNHLFRYFCDTLKEVVSEEKRNGRFDMGILDLGLGNDTVQKLETKIFIYRAFGTTSRVELHKVAVERGLSWEGAFEIFKRNFGPDDGFYEPITSGFRKTAALIHEVKKRHAEGGEKMYNLYRPNTGLNSRLETLADLKKRLKKTSCEVAESNWTEHYQLSERMCQHEFWMGKCRAAASGGSCEAGKRKRLYHILAGSVLSVWNLVDEIISNFGRRIGSRMQVIRVRTVERQKIVGVLIPSNCLVSLDERLTRDAIRTYTEKPSGNATTKE